MGIFLSPGSQAAAQQGLAALKRLSPNDATAVVTRAIVTPYAAPDGSPLDGQAAIPVGIETVPFIDFILDTSSFLENVNDIVCRIGDASGVHAGTCASCSVPTNTIEPIIGSANCNAYAAMLAQCCSQPFIFSALEVQVSKLGSNATTASALMLPEKATHSMRNLLGQGSTSPLFIAVNENLEAFERTTKAFAAVALINQQARFDSNTQWEIGGLQGARQYRFRFVVAAQKVA
jgi:hypothetical protein